jgi:hypothetical protein
METVEVTEADFKKIIKNHSELFDMLRSMNYYLPERK